MLGIASHCLENNLIPFNARYVLAKLPHRRLIIALFYYCYCNSENLQGFLTPKPTGQLNVSIENAFIK